MVIRMKKILFLSIILIGFNVESCNSGSSFHETINEFTKENQNALLSLKGDWKGEIFCHGIEKSEQLNISINNDNVVLKNENTECQNKYRIVNSDKHQMIRLVNIDEKKNTKCIFSETFTIIPAIDGKLITFDKNINLSLAKVNSIYVQFPKVELLKEFCSGFLDKQTQK